MLSALRCKLQRQGQLEEIEQLEGGQNSRNSYQKLLSSAGKLDIYQIVESVAVPLTLRLVLDSLP
jgi:hypothetical protein